ncbi:PiggyBac transposable element-derived protein 4 [Trichostrongylus colubriformis]|uniref:PiggyBac transposable element-derived protein 4 n=1 Tax=Trichostrongylus colubriformis TaxID=6319 RepID=A0AAN8FL54_TRICO
MSDLDESFERLLLDSDEEVEEAGEADIPVLPMVDIEEEDVEDEEESDKEEEEDDVWSSMIIPHDHIPFTGDHGVKDELLFRLKEPAEFFRYFLNENLIDLILTETNRYGKAKKDTFEPLDETEFWKFFAICLHMGIERRAHLKEYWSTRAVYSKSFCAQYISRARFVEILNSLHFADNEAADRTNRLYKVARIVELLNQSFYDAYTPGRDVCVDESIVPFRGRVLFRQYVKGKRHKYGIKLFKLCMQGGYTCRFIVYAGKDVSRQGSLAEDIVLKLMSGLLDSGRSLYTDNFYTSIPLAEKLVAQNTHLIGTLRKNRAGLPREVVCKRLKRGEQIGRQNGTGVTILKWKDKRDVLMLSTKHDDTHTANNKLRVIEDYNQVKDNSDQCMEALQHPQDQDFPARVQMPADRIFFDGNTPSWTSCSTTRTGTSTRSKTTNQKKMHRLLPKCFGPV